jgi:glycerate 2-kinase
MTEQKKPLALIACDKFKGSLDAAQACIAIQRGLGDDWSVDLCPIADGGEGFVSAMVAALAGTMVTVPCHDALGRAIITEYGIVEKDGKRIAVMEMAAASGMWRIATHDRDVLRSSTFGTGEMMRHAVQIHHVEQIIMGIGGSATNDGGAGMAAALGVKFYDASEKLLDPTPSALRELKRIDFSEMMTLPEILVACDVDNPLCGSRGASAIYGPQKGARHEDVRYLDQLLEKLAVLSNGQTQASTLGAGAAGGLGFGLLRFCQARLLPGFEMVASMIGLHERIFRADLIITGEGSLDEQSLYGKGPVGVARLCSSLSKPCVAVAGKVSPEVLQSGLFADAIDLSSLHLPMEIMMSDAGKLLEKIVVARELYWRDLALYRR